MTGMLACPVSTHIWVIPVSISILANASKRVQWCGLVQVVHDASPRVLEVATRAPQVAAVGDPLIAPLNSAAALHRLHDGPPRPRQARLEACLKLCPTQIFRQMMVLVRILQPLGIQVRAI